MTQLVNYNDIRDTFLNLLKAQNTTTADTYNISTSLPVKIVTITDLDARVHKFMQSEYPVVSVVIDQKSTENLKEFGNGKASRELEVRFKVHCIYDSFSDTDRHLTTMVQNVEALVREKIAFNRYSVTNGTDRIRVRTVEPSKTDFKTLFSNEVPYNRSAAVEVAFVIDVT